MKKRQVPFHKPSPWKKVAIHQNGTLSELEQHLTLISDNDQRDDGYDAAAADDDDIYIMTECLSVCHEK